MRLQSREEGEAQSVGGHVKQPFSKPAFSSHNMHEVKQLSAHFLLPLRGEEEEEEEEEEASAPCKASRAGAMRSEWKAPATFRGMARLTPASRAWSASR